jgi:hypothetical protein
VNELGGLFALGVLAGIRAMELLKDRDFLLLVILSTLASATALAALIGLVAHLLQ